MTKAADIIARIRFKLPEENGRQTPLTGIRYGCVMFVGRQAFECRIPLNGRTLEPGSDTEIPIIFMNPDLVRPLLQIGTAIRLWEGKDIATGTVLRILSE